MAAGVVLLLLAIAQAACEVIQVQVVHRHGMREHLNKDGQHPGLENGPRLLPQGVLELNDLGRYVRQRYLSGEAPDSRLRESSPDFTGPWDALSISTNVDRTLSSARAFMVGLYPDQHQRVPTEVFAALDRDHRLRGYALCQRYTDAVRRMLKGDDFGQKERENAAFLKRIAPGVDEEPALSNVFNVYDKYALNMTRQPGQRLNATDSQRLKELADWTESRKLGITVDNVWPGGALLATMFGYTDAALAKEAGPRAHRIIEYSAHYPTLLTLLAAARSGGGGNAELTSPANSIPAFGSALLWEVHRYPNGTAFVRIYWRAGAGERMETISVIRNEDEVRRRVSSDAAAFCAACGADARKTTLCAASGECRAAAVRHGAIGAALGACGVLALWAVVVVLVARRRGRARHEVELEAASEEERTDDPGWSGVYPKYEGVVLGAGRNSGPSTD